MIGALEDVAKHRRSMCWVILNEGRQLFLLLLGAGPAFNH